MVILIIFIILFIPTPLSLTPHHSQFIIWNVGQGQWATLMTKRSCVHFDMGGEFNIVSTVAHLCSHKNNQLALSHWDWDHLSFVSQFKNRINDLCLYKIPLGNSSIKKKSILRSIPNCKKQLIEYKEIIYHRNKTYQKSNYLSRVYVAANQFLIPGDSPQSEEKKWSQNLPRLNLIKGLILGHHGSRTSTSDDLLSRLSRLQWVIISSRQKRYGHPHSATLLKLKKRNIPAISTESWGHIHWLLE